MLVTGHRAKCGFHARFAVDEEIRRGDDLVAFSQSIEYFKPTISTGAESDVDRYELVVLAGLERIRVIAGAHHGGIRYREPLAEFREQSRDRKSTRLNSSHV